MSTEPPPRIVTLVVDRPRGTIGPFEVAMPWWQETSPVVEAGEALVGAEIEVVRLIDADRFPGGPVTYLVEAPGVDPSRLGPWSGDVADDPNLADHARIGGPRAAVAWADDRLAERGERRVGRAQQVRSWNLSALWRIPTTGGDRWLKALPSFFATEGPLMAALAEIAPDTVPRVLAAEPGRFLTADVAGVDGYGIEPDGFMAAVDRFVDLQRSIDPVSLLALGVGEVDASALAAGLQRLADLHRLALDADHRAHLARIIDEVPDRFATASIVSPALVHGDLHGGNLRVRADGSSVILDWADAFIGNPLFDLAALDSYVPDWPNRVRDRWLDRLVGSVSAGRSAWEALRPVAALRTALVFQAFCDRIPAAELPYHQPDVVPALARGIGLDREQ